MDSMERTYVQHLLGCPTEIREQAIRTGSYVGFDLKRVVVMDTLAGEVISQQDVAWNFRLINPYDGSEV